MVDLARQKAKKNTATQMDNLNYKNDSQEENKSNVVVGAFGTKSKPVQNQNELGLAGENIAGPVKKLLEDQTFIKKTANDNEQEKEDFIAEKNFKDSDEGENLQDEIPENLDLNVKIFTESEEESKKSNFIEIIKSEFEKINLKINDDEALKLLDSNFKVKFPWIMFSFCVFYEFGNLILGIVSIFLSVVLPPIGFMFMLVQLVEGFIFTIFFFFWTNYYSTEASDFTKKVPIVRRFMIRNLFKRFWVLLIQDIPYIGKIIPVNTFMVYYTFKYLEKLNSKAEISTQKAAEDSGLTI